MEGLLTLHLTGIFADEQLARFAKRDTLVCGGRDYYDARRICWVLDAMKPTRIIEGGQRGADTLAREWAIANYVPFDTFNAEWDKHSRNAGPIRNTRMLDEGKPQVIVAFPGRIGTGNMVKLARMAGVPVLEIGR